MTTENRETLQRTIGILEGASFGAEKRVGDALALACSLLDAVLMREGK